ncbi:HAD family hydrolase [Halobaculum sp. MBLA0147]|uniref:HAD family hydrolase n=1 Tax=Halobaculum sp. MBLA0147 TaxID=3079934 RepID=UPI003524FAE8
MSDSSTLAVVFDFDDTLAPDSTTYLLEENGVDPGTFWSERFENRISDGYDPTVAYLTLLLDLVGEDEPLGTLTESDLRDYGSELDDELYEGVPGLFDDVRAIVAEYDTVDVEFYVVTEALGPIVRGTHVADECEAVYASEVATDENDVVDHVKRPISFTDKTRYLFEINKGIERSAGRDNPFAVNESRDESARAIPFENVIYVGNGMTDIPCFSLVNDRNGHVFAVSPTSESHKQRAIRDIGSPRRTRHASEPAYGTDSRLGSLLRLTIEGLCTERTIDELEAL